MGFCPTFWILSFCLFMCVQTRSSETRKEIAFTAPPAMGSNPEFHFKPTLHRPDCKCLCIGEKADNSITECLAKLRDMHTLPANKALLPLKPAAPPSADTNRKARRHKKPTRGRRRTKRKRDKERPPASKILYVAVQATKHAAVTPSDHLSSVRASARSWVFYFKRAFDANVRQSQNTSMSPESPNKRQRTRKGLKKEKTDVILHRLVDFYGGKGDREELCADPVGYSSKRKALQQRLSVPPKPCGDRDPKTKPVDPSDSKLLDIILLMRQHPRLHPKMEALQIIPSIEMVEETKHEVGIGGTSNCRRGVKRAPKKRILNNPLVAGCVVGTDLTKVVSVMAKRHLEFDVFKFEATHNGELGLLYDPVNDSSGIARYFVEPARGMQQMEKEGSASEPRFLSTLWKAFQLVAQTVCNFAMDVPIIGVPDSSYHRVVMQDFLWKNRGSLAPFMSIGLESMCGQATPARIPVAYHRMFRREFPHITFNEGEVRTLCTHGDLFDKLGELNAL